MAEQEKLTKAERKEQRRQERLQAEEAAAAKAAKDRVRNSIIGVVVVAMIGGMVFLALDNAGGEAVVAGDTITQAEGEEALAAAGCEVIDNAELEDRTHYEPNTIPPAETIYTAGRPTDSGPHYTRPQGVVDGISNRQLDEYSTTHNLEHGALIFWYEPDAVEGDVVDTIDQFVSSYNAAGFEQELSGAGLFGSPYEDITTSDKPVALRAWGVSMDCDTINETALKAFTIEHYGTNGTAPEAALGPYPSEVLGYDDGSADEPAEGEVDPGDMTVEDDATTDDTADDEG